MSYYCQFPKIFVLLELAEDDEQYTFKIEFHGSNNRSYVLGAESQESMEQWMKALACAGYDYIKLMVAELQRQLDDIEGRFQAQFFMHEIKICNANDVTVKLLKYKVSSLV